MIKCIEITMWNKGLDYDYLLSVKHRALLLGLKGVAFFKNDGSIKVTAEGEEKNLNIFINKLKRGRFFLFFFSPMNSFFVKWQEARYEFDNFSISKRK